MDGYDDFTGLIPASAGQTNRVGEFHPVIRAHPRECGADAVGISTSAGGQGSSPRVRGRRHALRQIHVIQGLIPASAGQTASGCVGEAWCGAHPRECGADSNCSRDGRTRSGSSPRVRGRQGRDVLNLFDEGLIPASAGQTRRRKCTVLMRGAHPRECGADDCARVADRRFSGSSPRVRGRRGLGGHSVARVGLIPASAGQTPPSTALGQISTAHPRECGADCFRSDPEWCARGSSPRVRGRPGR